MSEEGHDLSLYDRSQIKPTVDQFADGLNRYLNSVGLPSDDVLVDQYERTRVITNLPDIVDKLPAGRRQNAHYISKFVAACGAGLFDAALNYVWNETVSALRKRVANFDIDYFADAVVTEPKRRSRISSEEDLREIDDWELIRGCHTTGLISDVAFYNLELIRNMRNHASAAHPNQNELTGLQLAAWLETCILHVLSTEPTGPIITVQSLLRSIRTQAFTAPQDIAAIVASISNLPKPLASNFLKSVVGLFSDETQDAQVRSNILAIANAVWGRADEQSKFDTGIKYAKHQINGEITKKDAVYRFLQAVNGLTYLPPDTLAVELDTAINALYSAHTNYNNFANEFNPASRLRTLVPATGAIPPAVETNYGRTLFLCRVGNQYGTSFAAKEIYTELWSRADDRTIMVLLWLLIHDTEIRNRLGYARCKTEARELFRDLQTRTGNPAVRELLRQLADAQDPELARPEAIQGFKAAVLGLFG